MTHKGQITKEDWEKLPSSFRRVRLELARERGHPEGDRRSGYTLVVPLDAEGRIDAALWQKYHEFCRVVRFRRDAADEVGHLVRKPGGAWAFRYDIKGEDEDETGYHFSSERFAPGEYVSVREADGLHPFRVISVEPV
ncbi:MAG TPA: hypothetical protein VFF88_01265 [Methylocella sp.]|nr:hypothetical protein [Methylocella sp.]